MTCKDCIKADVCELAYHLWDEQEVEKRCKHFKNKADFVEVVRCEKCKYCVTHTCAITGIKTLFCDYGEKPAMVHPTHFCSYGERAVNYESSKTEKR